jgi:hypothetical protein
VCFVKLTDGVYHRLNWDGTLEGPERVIDSTWTLIDALAEGATDVLGPSHVLYPGKR